MEFFKSNSSVGFMRARKIAYAISAVMFVVSIGALVFKGLNFGVDFTGGVTIEAKFTQQAQPETLRRSFEAAGFEDVQVQNFGSSRDVAIRLPPPSGETADAIRARVETVLRAADANVVISRAEIVGPQVGAELRNSAIVALISTLILIFIYVFLRFHAWQLSAGAILAAIHDPIIVLGFFALTGMVFDLSVVAALLAVIGYSLNDTVVVFDRIREYLADHKGARADKGVINYALNSTLSRTFNTSWTTIIVLLVIFIFGGEVLRGFIFAILLGIVVGTYSSLFVASPILYDATPKDDKTK